MLINAKIIRFTKHIGRTVIARGFRHLLSALTLLSSFLFADLASAQEAGGPGTPPPGIEEITVIGSKINANRQELSTSVGYFDSERIRAEAIYNVEDVFDRTANAFKGTTGFGAYSIRGVNNNGIAGAFGNANALASVILNGAAMGINGGDYVKPSLFDAASLEILRGPQSSLQGPNSLIGAVHVNYNRPRFGSDEGSVRVEGGELGTQRLGLVQNFELVDDILAARLVLEKRDSDGAVTNTVTMADDVQREDEETVRLALRLQPYGDESLVFDLTHIRNDSDSNAFGHVVPPSGGDLFDRQQPFNVEDRYPTEFSQSILEIGWRLNAGWRFTSLTGSSGFELTQRFDGDLSPFPVLSVDGFGGEDLFSQEFRLNYESGRLDGLVGVFYSDGEYRSGFSGAGLFPIMGMLVPFNSATDITEVITQQALFGHLAWRFTDSLQLDLGVRLNSEERETDNFANNPTFGVIDRSLSSSETFNQVIPTAELAWQAADGTRLGFKYAKGFQAGGIAFAVFLGRSQPYDEEFTDNYEVFLRHQSDDGQFIFNANIFHTDWSDQQVSVALPGGVPQFDLVVENTGKSQLRGMEVEFEWLMSDRITMFTSLGFIDTEFKDFMLTAITPEGQSLLVNLVGESFPQAPDFNLSLGLNWDSGRGWYGATTYSHTDEVYTDVGNPDLTGISARRLLSGRFGYAAERWRAYFWGSNLLDQDYELSLFDGALLGLTGAYGRIGPPRTAGLGVEFDW